MPKSQAFFERLRLAAQSLGFVSVGVTRSLRPTHYARYESWVEAGHHGSMHYMAEARRRALRSNVQELFQATQSVVVVGMSYKPKDQEMPSTTHIARYAFGEDYHVVMKKGLEALAQWLTQELGPHTYKVCVDTSPILERDFAEQAGVGWIGKNTCIIHPKHGSYLLLGEILTSHVLNESEKIPFHCGTCTRCLDACPTQAFEGPFQLNATKCISYHTLESRAPEIPEAITQKNTQWLAGCDICQEVCPWNRKAPPTEVEAFAPKTHVTLSADAFQSMTEQDLGALLAPTALSRIKPEQMKRNVASLRKARTMSATSSDKLEHR